MGFVILGLLTLSPHTLYALNKQFETTISLFYSASLGSIRSALLALEARGHATAVHSTENGRNKKTYSITSSGREAFFEWMHAPITGNTEVAALSRLFFLGTLPDAAERAAVLSAIEARIAEEQQQLESLDAELAGYEVPEEYATLFHYQRLTLEYGVRSHRFAREWFETLISREQHHDRAGQDSAS